MKIHIETGGLRFHCEVDESHYMNARAFLNVALKQVDITFLHMLTTAFVEEISDRESLIPLRSWVEQLIAERQVS